MTYRRQSQQRETSVIFYNKSREKPLILARVDELTANGIVSIIACFYNSSRFFKVNVSYLVLMEIFKCSDVFLKKTFYPPNALGMTYKIY